MKAEASYKGSSRSSSAVSARYPSFSARFISATLPLSQVAEAPEKAIFILFFPVQRLVMEQSFIVGPL